MGFVHWVGSFFRSIPHDLAKLIGAVTHTFHVVWNLLTSLGHLVGKAWHHLLGAAHRFATVVDELAHATYLALRRILTHTIPHAIAGALRDAARFAGRLVDDLRIWAKAAYKAALAFASKVANAVKQWAVDAFHFLTSTISRLADTLGHVARIVGNLLDRPEHLAAWLIDALWREALRLVQSQATAITRYLLRHAVAIALRSVTEIESVLTDIF